MATGSGLPILKGGQVLAQSPGIMSGDALYNARDWDQIARSGERLAKEATHELDIAARQREVGYLAGQENEITRQQIDMRNKHANEPGAFDAAWKAYSDEKLSDIEPRSVEHVRKVLGERGNSAYSSILNERRNFDEKQDAERVTTLATQTSSEVLGAAMAGTLATPEGRAKLEKYRSVLDSAVTSGLMTAEKRDLIFEDTLSKAEGETAARNGVSIYREGGGNYQGAVDYLTKNILENEKLGLSASSRRSAFNTGMAAINRERTVDKTDKAEIVQSGRDLFARIKSGQVYSEEEVRESAALALRVGSTALHRQLLIEHQVRQETAGRGLTELAGAVMSRRASTIDLRRLAQIESGGNPNAVSPTGAKGLYQFTGGTAAQYGLTNPFDVAASTEAVKRLWTDNANVLSSRLGRQPTGGELYLAHQQGAGGAAALLSNPTANVVDALAPAYGGDRVKAAQAITVNGGHPDMTAGAFAQKWINKYEGGTNQYAGEITKGVQEALVTSARRQWPTLKLQIDAGNMPDVDDVNAVRIAAAVSGDQAWMKQVEEVAVAQKIGGAMKDMSATQAQALMDQAQSQLSEGVTKSLRAQFDRKNRMVEKEPIRYAIESGMAPPPELVIDNSDQFRAGLKGRSNIVQGVADKEGRLPGPALQASELAAVKARLEVGSADDKLRIFTDMAAAMPEPVYQATMEAIGNDNVTQFAGRVALQRPELAREILRGAELQTLEKTGDKGSLVRPAFQAKIGRDLYPSVADQKNVTDAAMAVYTARRGSSGALYDPTDSAGIEKAIEDVAGKVVKRGGVKVAIPPGMTEAQFSGAFSALTAERLAQFGGAFDRNGKPFDPAFLGERSVLKQLGPGESNYVVGIADPTARDGFAPVMTGEGRPLVVDAKQLAASAPPRALTPYEQKRATFRRTQAEAAQEATRQAP